MEKREKLSVPFHYLGYFSDAIQLKRNQDSIFKTIRINTDSFDFNVEKNICTIGLDVVISYYDTKDNLLSYITGYKIDDKEIIDLFVKYISGSKDNSEEPKEEVNRFISILLASAFPFIRQHVYAVTSDANNPVNIPTIDIRYLNLSKAITIENKTRKKPTSQNIEIS